MNKNSRRLSFLTQLTMMMMMMMMMRSPVVCVILLTLTGVQQHAATWPASTMQVRVGDDAVLQWPLLDISNATTATPTPDGEAPTTLSWYRKAAGRGPTLLLSITSSNGSHVRYGDDVQPGKVSAAADGSLLLRGSQESDSGVYYCGISYGSELKDRMPRPVGGNETY